MFDYTKPYVLLNIFGSDFEICLKCLDRDLFAPNSLHCLIYLLILISLTKACLHEALNIYVQAYVARFLILVWTLYWYAANESDFFCFSLPLENFFLFMLCFHHLLMGGFHKPISTRNKEWLAIKWE